MSLKDKIEKVVVEIYGGEKVEYTPKAEECIARYSNVWNIYANYLPEDFFISSSAILPLKAHSYNDLCRARYY